MSPVARGSLGPERRPPAVARIALAVLTVFALASCASDDGGRGSARDPGTRYVEGSGAVTVVPAGERGRPVALSGDTLDGGRLDVAGLRGAPIVINVWGSWCPPCRKEAPDLQAAYQRLRDDGVDFVGINTRDRPAQALAYERRFGVTYPSLRDDGGRLLLALRGAVPPAAIPTTLVLDHQGRIAARVSGPVDTSTLVGLVSDVLAETAPTAGGATASPTGGTTTPPAGGTTTS